MTTTVGKINGQIVQVVRVAHTVGFSEETGWVLVCMDWQQAERKKKDFKWVPATTRFEWVRTFNFSS